MPEKCTVAYNFLPFGHIDYDNNTMQHFRQLVALFLVVPQVVGLAAAAACGAALASGTDVGFALPRRLLPAAALH